MLSLPRAFFRIDFPYYICAKFFVSNGESFDPLKTSFFFSGGRGFQRYGDRRHRHQGELGRFEVRG